MKRFMAVITLSLLSFSILAADDSAKIKNSFSCMDKETFEVDAACISSTIEMSDKFAINQADLYKKASQPGDYVMATLLMDPETLNITVIGHTDKERTPVAALSVDR